MASAHYDVGSVIIGEGVITSLNYHRDGRWLVMSTNESSIQLIDALSGEEKKKLYSKSSGVGVLTYTHHESCVLHSSEKTNEMKYLCLYDNRVLRSFPGHIGRVTSVSMSPVDDNFLTASGDNTVRLWNLASPCSIAKISLPQYTESPLVVYDGSGMVFGVHCYDSWKKCNAIKLFDARNYEAGPFQNIVPESTILENAIVKSNPSISNFQAQKMLQSKWTGFEFSPDGNHLLVNTATDQLFLLDGFRSEVEPQVFTRKNENNLALAACFSSNAKLVITATDDNDVQTIDKVTGELKSSQAVHVAPVSCIRSNPKYDQIASGCVNTVLWIPKDSSSSSSGTVD